MALYPEETGIIKAIDGYIAYVFAPIVGCEMKWNTDT